MSFLSNQCLEETRRIGRDNGKLLIDHFIQMSQTQCSYINQTHVMWADFLSHFQDSTENAAYYEAEVGGNTEDHQINNRSGVRRQEEAKDNGKNENDGGSGGTTKIENDEEEDQNQKKKKKVKAADLFATETQP